MYEPVCDDESLPRCHDAPAETVETNINSIQQDRLTPYVA